MTNKGDEELCELAGQNILASRNKQLDMLSCNLSRELYEELVGEYESEKKGYYASRY